MARIGKETLETIFGKMIDEKPLDISGFKKPINFEIYDGFAYCEDHQGHEYSIEYPRIDLIEKSKELQDDIRKWLDMGDDDKITIFDIIQTFNVMYRDGHKVKYESKERKWVEID